ncbi:MAG TPA: PadR family transcriptional regulator [Candidatus Bathyarchaeia archaeon]|nr:PadR family transcriptional regulator [Candidatus Bathyarchaeia archaeon]
MQRDFVEDLRERTIKSFMDILALKELEKESAISSYDLIMLIHKKFAVLVSSGTVYATVYSLERRGLIEGAKNRRKTVYMLTDKGEKALQDIKKAKSELQSLMTIVF